jgi:hypothetical protein
MIDQAGILRSCSGFGIHGTRGGQLVWVWCVNKNIIRKNIMYVRPSLGLDRYCMPHTQTVQAVGQVLYAKYPASVWVWYGVCIYVCKPKKSLLMTCLCRWTGTSRSTSPRRRPYCTPAPSQSTSGCRAKHRRVTCMGIRRLGRRARGGCRV